MHMFMHVNTSSPDLMLSGQSCKNLNNLVSLGALILLMLQKLQGSSGLAA